MAPSGKEKVKNEILKALPTEWKPINKNCIIWQLNGTAIKNSRFNGDTFVQKTMRNYFFYLV